MNFVFACVQNLRFCSVFEMIFNNRNRCAVMIMDIKRENLNRFFFFNIFICFTTQQLFQLIHFHVSIIIHLPSTIVTPFQICCCCCCCQHSKINLILRFVQGYRFVVCSLAVHSCVRWLDFSTVNKEVAIYMCV